MRLGVSSAIAMVALVVFCGRVRGESASSQIARGGDAYANLCAECHGAMLDGGRGPALKGDDFLQKWKQKTARELYARILTSMPVSSPGTLEPSTVLDLTMYVLQQNDVNVGSQAKTSSDLLNSMVITR